MLATCGLAAAASSGLAMWAALAVGVPLVHAGQLDGVCLASVALIALAAAEPIAALPGVAVHACASSASARRLAELDTPAPRAEPADEGVDPVGASLSVRDVSFSYDAGRGPALEGVSLDLAVGRRVAVVGASGSGKSTLAAVLLGLLEPDEGRLLLDGADVADLHRGSVLSVLGGMLQRTGVFSTTLRDNIIMAKPDAEEAAIREAVRAARLEDLVAAIEGGLSARVGAGGRQLSAGECQRIGLARVFLRAAPIVVLDEPTAHLDPATERAVLRELLDWSAGRALLVATHRLVAMDQMDEIVVLDQGRVAERGTHAELLSRSGGYRRLWDRQQGSLEA
jgi:ABC-type transport system involved in cytochrome bd biosynthesis fused ATPase/permease subunit